jgi:hypothetical protein
VLVAVQEKQAGTDPQEIQAQEVQEKEEKERTCPNVWIINLVRSSETSPEAS